MGRRRVTAGNRIAVTEVADDVMRRPPSCGRTRVVAVDGGSGAGKTTLASRLARALDAPVVHTDDLAWWESFFGWHDLLITGVLEPLSTQRHVRYRPPAWDRRGRPGAIDAPPAPAVVIEGVGAARREVAPYLAFAIWVDTGRQVAMDRGVRREGETRGFWREWGAAEEAHLDRDRPWVRADLVVSNDLPADVDDGRELVVIAAATWSRDARPR